MNFSLKRAVKKSSPFFKKISLSVSGLLAITLLGFFVFTQKPISGDVISVGAQTYYVSKSGSDTNCDGLSEVDDPGSGTLPRNCAFSTIQHAVDAASDGDSIYVAAGTYIELVTIDKQISLFGATKDISKKGYTVPNSYGWDDSVETIIQPPSASADEDVLSIDDADNVTVQGFVIQALERTGSGSRHLVHVYIDDKTMENLNLVNNVIGANTNALDQDGKKGRMNVDIDLNPYDGGQGLINSLISGNKIFGSDGNGNGLFLWGSYASYGATGPSPMDGTVIENNEICCGHRSGIEIAGGVSNLLIQNNSIHDFSSILGDDDILKYGNGVLMIRGAGDKEDCGGFGPSNVTLKNNEIYDNEKNAIYMGPNNEDVMIESNYLHDNGRSGVQVDLIGVHWNPDFDDSPGPYTCLGGSSNVVANYNKFENNTQYGVRVNGTPSNGFELDAVYNWWNSSNGPGGVGSGGGDDVTAHVDYMPWYATDSTNTTNQGYYKVMDGSEVVAYSDDLDAALAALDLDSNYILSGSKVKTDSTQTQTSSGEDTVDDKDNTGLEVDKSGSGTPRITPVSLEENPHGGDTGFDTFGNSYVDVHLDSTENVDEVTVKLWYTDGDIEGFDEDTLRMKYWDGDSWENCSDTGVNMTDSGNYSGYVWATFNTSSVPDISYLTGQTLVAGGDMSLADTGNGIILSVAALIAIVTVLATEAVGRRYNSKSAVE
jgi:hypothetical protein